MPDDANLTHLQATIASFRYWVPSVSDVARVGESDAGGVWRLTVAPFQAGACPFELTLTREGGYALSANGVAHPEQRVDSLDVFLPIAEAITDGSLVQHVWSSASTAIATRVDTVITLADGRLWQGSARLPSAGLVPPGADEICRSRHFLPYRRR